MTVDEIYNWLLDGAPGASSAEAIAERLGNDLLAAGIPIERLCVFVTTLHPNVLGRAFIWERGKPFRLGTLTKEVRASRDFTHSPVNWTYSNRREWRWRKGEPDLDYGVIRDLEAKGCVDYFTLPIFFTNGDVHVVTFSSNTGFSEEHLAGLRKIIRPLSRLAEIYAFRRVAENVLRIYVGTHSGERVLQGRIFQGDVETIRAAIWFSDMRGFTEMSSRTPAKNMIAILNDIFECQVPAIEKHGGEVLKFIGDGLLAIFPIKDSAPAKDRCLAALEAARETFAAMSKLATRIGLALHIGDVEYGNIGGATRLDFTAIGPAVNLAARLEGLTSKLGRSVVVSEDFARTCEIDLEDLGTFDLKGIEAPKRVYGFNP